MKALKTIKKILIVTFGIVYFSFALVMTVLLLNFNDYRVTVFGETSLVILKDKVSHEDYQKGDLVLVEEAAPENLQVGETVFVYKVDQMSKTADINIGKVGEVNVDNQVITLENGDPYSLKYLIGRPTKVYNGIGTVLNIIESQWGFLFIVLVPCFLIFIYELYALIVEIKYGDEVDVEE